MNNRYINDFSKALAGEVKILLAEVGKLRDEKRALQFEIAELMSIKAKHSADGVYAPGWAPVRHLPTLPYKRANPNHRIESQPPPEAPAAPEPPAAPPAPAPPGWRTVHAPRAARRKPLALPAAAPPPPPAPAPPAPAPDMPAWAQWRPNPLLAPVTAGPSPVVAPPPRSGLFGAFSLPSCSTTQLLPHFCTTSLQVREPHPRSDRDTGTMVVRSCPIFMFLGSGYTDDRYLSIHSISDSGPRLYHFSRTYECILGLSDDAV
ncbi:hypothetical protein B0H12DRAFT_1027699 [Mycena haematopus]|nr:hypothetical protein B0H12DRAFT_1027699 [Mycena haematopus]